MRSLDQASERSVKKKILSQVGIGSTDESHKYRVDGEVGRFEFESYRVKGADGVEDSAGIFPRLTGQEWYRTAGFKEWGYGHGSINGSYRHTTSWLNRLRHQAEARTPSRTLPHNSEQEGEALLAHLDQIAGQVLAAHQFEGHYPLAEQRAAYQSQDFRGQATQQVVEVVKACAPDPGDETEILSNPVPYEVGEWSNLCPL